MKFLFVVLSISLIMCSADNSNNSDDSSSQTDQSATSERNEAALEQVIKDYFMASNDKNAAKIPTFIYPKIYNDQIKKEDVEAMFYQQLNAMKKFEFSDLEFDGETVVLDESNTDRFYSKKYQANITIELDSTMAPGFTSLVDMVKKSDPNAKIDSENYSIVYQEKKKLMLVQNATGTYIVPDTFLAALDGNDIDANKILAAYNAIP